VKYSTIKLATVQPSVSAAASESAVALKAAGHANDPIPQRLA